MLLLVGLGLLLVACAPSPTETLSPLNTPAPAPIEPATLEPTATSVPSPTAEPAALQLSPEVALLADQARLDLSIRTGIALDRITVQSVEAVQWSNSSLGCPQPGMMYLQVITPGYIMLLEASGGVYEYHTSQTLVVYCDRPQPPYRREGGSE
jgi:hypothetical protein